MSNEKLIWADEFDYTGAPDPKKWTHQFGGHGWGNNEAQYYTDSLENCVVQDGVLKIIARKEKTGDNQYTSARIHTFGNFSFKYGKVLVRARVPKGKGTWPAIWLLGNAVREGKGWPLGGEIDLMEYSGQNPDEVVFSLHTKAYNHHKKNHRTFVYNGFDFSKDFHEYGLVWKPDYIEFLLDGNSVKRFNRGDLPLDTGEEGWPFDSEFFLIINLAIGGSMGGPIDDSIFPVCFEIDYVRVYEVQNEEEDDI
ncbi:MAG TPA: glycoside hydrolase family 16 protein [Bacilli bacterium]